jgi:copper chaperone CopZ
MKTLFFLTALAVSISLHAQKIVKVSLQASGLTCSMCSNSINKALKTVDFVEKVVPNIETSTFEISFKQNANVDFDKLKKKVEDAGFSVSKFIAVIDFNDAWIKNDASITIGDKTLVFTNVKDQKISGQKPVQIIDKGFVSAKTYKKNPVQSFADRIYHATI